MLVLSNLLLWLKQSITNYNYLVEEAKYINGCRCIHSVHVYTWCVDTETYTMYIQGVDTTIHSVNTYSGDTTIRSENTATYI